MPDDEPDRRVQLSRRGLTGDATTFRRVEDDDDEASWATRLHPGYGRWFHDEKKQRASYIATKDELDQFLVPHHFEGADEGKTGPELNRAQFGFAVGLNAMWVLSILGHIRSQTVQRNWGPLTSEDGEESGQPADSPARELFSDIDLRGTRWDKWWNGKILEWMLTSVGGFVLVDLQQDGANGDRRPVHRWYPWSSVEDYSFRSNRFEQLKFREVIDTRDITSSNEQEFTELHLVLEIQPDGSTMARKVDNEGDTRVGPRDMGTFRNFRGQPNLPVVNTGYRDHPVLEHVSQGLLMGLDDIVIDLFNQISEAREGFRDAAFSVTTYKGPGASQVRDQFASGSRFIPLGDDENAEFERHGGNTTEVDAAAQLFNLALKAWRLSAHRKKVEAAESMVGRSGESLKTEFELDERPILVQVAEGLDDAESLALLYTAQAQDNSFDATGDAAREMGVTRNTEFQLEEEPSRISRVMEEFQKAFGTKALTTEAGERVIMTFWEESDLLDLDREVEMEDGERPLREVVRDEVRDFLEMERERSRNRAAASAGAAGEGLPL